MPPSPKPVTPGRSAPGSAIEDKLAEHVHTTQDRPAVTSSRSSPGTPSTQDDDDGEYPGAASGEASEAGEWSALEDAEARGEQGGEDASKKPPPLPAEPVPEDDGWEFQWNAAHQAYFFYNRFTGKSQWDNPRVPSASAASDASTSAPAPAPASGAAPTPGISAPNSVAGGYNPAIHGDYDPNAWYAQAARAQADQGASVDSAGDASQQYASGGLFNRQTGAWQAPEQGPEHHGDDAKSRRQLNTFFDFDAAANAHDGRSLRAERANMKPTKAEVKAFKEKRRARKEEKRRAWLRD